MKEQVKSLFEENVRVKSLELKTTQDVISSKCYGYPGQLRGIIDSNPKVKEKFAEIKEGIKKLFRSWRVISLSYDGNNYGLIPNPSYYNEKFNSRTVDLTLKLHIDKLHIDGINNNELIFENIWFSFPFTGELKKLTLEWQKDVKEYFELEAKRKKLTEFEKNLDNHVNIFLLKNQNPELYIAANDFICNTIDNINF